MENAKVTVVITPRDRYTGIIECINNLYEQTPEPFLLKVLDLGYPKALKKQIIKLLENKNNAQIYDFGLLIPMEAMRKIRNEIVTPYVMFLDNDSNVTKNWLPPLLETAEQEQSAITSPLTLEKEGVDEGAELRNHLFTNEIRIVDIEGTGYLIEDKHFRRALPEDLPKGVHSSEIFEFHGVLFETQFLREIEIPQMVIREHIDIGMQTRKMKRKILVEPESVIIFDNLSTRMSLVDMKFFFFRWDISLTSQASRLFESRWGYNFYSEQSIYHWVFRRKIFLFCRWLFLPISLSNLVTRIAAKIKTLIKPVWDPLKDPVAESVNFYEREKFDN